MLSLGLTKTIIPTTLTPKRTLFTTVAASALLTHFIWGGDCQRADKISQNIDLDDPQRIQDRLTYLRDTRPQPPNYPQNVPLWYSEKLLLFLISGIRSYYHPENGINIVQLGESTAIPCILKNLKDTMLRDPVGREILMDKPIVNENNLKMETLKQYPKNTFGYQFYSWCRRENVTPDTRAPVKYINDPELAYVFKRFRQCHDFYHSICNLPIIIEGEITVKALEGANMGIPMAIMGSIFAPFRLTGIQRKRLFSTYLPWAFKTGLNCKPLINVYWEKCLDKDVNELRKELGIVVPPDLRDMRNKRRQDIKNLNEKYKAMTV